MSALSWNATISKLFLFWLMLISGDCFGQISHLEIGAANYSGSVQTNVQDRFKILFQTVEELVAADGNAGTIYLNDIDKSGLHLAAETLRKYILEKKLDIKVVEISENLFQHPDLVPSVNSAQMAFPDASMISNNANNTEAIKRFAGNSKRGLKVITFSSNVGEAFGKRFTGAVVAKETTNFVYRTPTGEPLENAGAFAVRVSLPSQSKEGTPTNCGNSFTKISN